MLSKFLNHRLISQIISVKRPISVRSTFDFGKQMKSFNENHQFIKALELFDKCKENSIETCSSMSIIQALKASAEIGDLQRGLTIHHLISSRIKNDPNIVTSLIHLYSKS
jgi:hypothetical protein